MTRTLDKIGGVLGLASVVVTVGAALRRRGFLGLGKTSDASIDDLMAVANDAALEGKIYQAVELFEQRVTPRILTSFTRYTPSEEDRDDHKTGWIDEDGDTIEIDANDIEDMLDETTPVTSALVTATVKWLSRADAREFSSSNFQPGGWYSSSWDTDYRTGAETQREFHLEGFTKSEEELIYKKMIW